MKQGLWIGATSLLALATPVAAQFNRGDWHTGDYPNRDQVMWMAISEDLKTSFPQGGAPVVATPFHQPVPHVKPLEDLKITGATALRDATATSVIVETAAGSVKVDASGATSPAEKAKPDNGPLLAKAGDYTIDGGKLARVHDGKVFPVNDFGRDGLPDDDVRDIVVSPAGELYAATPMGLGVLSADGNWSHITGRHGGLPVNDATCLSFAPDGGLWVGTVIGAAYRSPAGDWAYRQGPRWMIGDPVLDVAAFENGGVWILTAKSLTRIEPRLMTLREKAKIYDEITQARHVRHGAVTGCNFRTVGDFDSWYMSDNDNDGLWTSIYLGAKVFEYAVTGDPEALRLARLHFDFLHRLETINGIPGFISRSIRPSKYEPGGHEEYHYGGEGEWHESTVEPGWQWKADTSSDELSGHFFAWSVYYDLIAKNDPVEKKRVEELVRRVMNHLIDHDFTLSDVDGLPTRWAVYSPRLLRGDLLWSDQVAFNALGILAHLKSAIHICGDQKFKDAYNELIEKHQYDVKAMFSKEMIPNTPFAGVNHSDDEMAWLEYYHLLEYPDENPALTWRYKYSAVRSQRTEIPEKSPFFIVPFAIHFPQWAHMGDAVETLRDWPLDLRHWRAKNSHRDDVTVNPLQSRHRHPLLIQPVDIDERVPKKWNHDPYVSDDGGDGRSEEDGASWLLPYWMAVYHKLIIEKDVAS